MGPAKETLVLIDSLYRQYDLGNRHFDGAIFKPMVKSMTSNKVYRVFRKLHLSSSLPGKEIWLGSWQDDLANVDTVVLADGGNSENVARYIHCRYPQIRIILWYRNSVAAAGEPSKDISKFCEIWSFDQDDCRRYGYRLNPQFYGGNPNYQEHCPEWDAFFVGQDKGRLAQILDVQEKLEHVGLTTKFCIVGYNCDYLAYEKVLDCISRSRIIVDIQAAWQDGITLRPLEALFYQKKLLTNSKTYAQSDLYDANNSFVVGRDDWSSVKEILNTPYAMSPNHTILEQKYGIEGWLDRFNR